LSAEIRGILCAMTLSPLLLACDGGADTPDPDQPFVGTVTLFPAAPSTDDIVTVILTGTAGGLDYAGFVAGIAPAETSASLRGEAFSKGQDVQVADTATHSGRTTEATASKEVVVANTPPTSLRVALEATADGLVCTVNVAPTDADGDAVTTDLFVTTDDYASAGGTAPEDTTSPDAWRFPEGTRLWRPFEMEGVPVETRLLAAAFDAPPVPAPQLAVADPVEAEIPSYLHGNYAFFRQPAGVVSLVSVMTLDLRATAADPSLLDALPPAAS